MLEYRKKHVKAEDDDYEELHDKDKKNLNYLKRRRNKKEQKGKINCSRPVGPWGAVLRGYTILE